MPEQGMTTVSNCAHNQGKGYDDTVMTMMALMIIIIVVVVITQHTIINRNLIVILS